MGQCSIPIRVDFGTLRVNGTVVLKLIGLNPLRGGREWTLMSAYRPEKQIEHDPAVLVLDLAMTP